MLVPLPCEKWRDVLAIFHGFVESVEVLVLGREESAVHIGAQKVAEVWRQSKIVQCDYEVAFTGWVV